MDHRYIVVDAPAPGKDGDIYQTICPSAAEANSEAAYQWGHLTAAEQRRRHIYAGLVRRDDLGEFAVDADTGDTDWTCYVSMDTFPGAFDSEAIRND